MASKTAYNMLKTSIQRNRRTLSHISPKSYTTPSSDESKKKRNKATLETK